jgi:hypothetical protein
LRLLEKKVLWRVLYLRTEEMTRRPTKLRRFYSFTDEGRRDREMRNAYDTLSGKPKKIPFGIHKRSWENRLLNRM